MAAKKGLYRPTNVHKYRGNPDQIVYRSRWELVVMRRLDANPQVVWWSSERLVIQYVDRTTGKTRRYFPDFQYARRLADGREEVIVVEVKPSKESPDHAPPPTKRRGQSDARFFAAAAVWMKNLCKWEAAKAYCAARGWRFVIITEHELGIKK